ncbi:recombinase family protein [Paenibacillus nasutitermitis]|uniref:Recombinase family protein n=1 Tax=Paenibacillus nasutitermitis TaxID=1652958 RepID=A0A916YLG4_9BACL|nr:recombinase family protein [Paenibacillus nasutitermitis]GGD50135.1 hypothetical protein GCM10010911_04610 [Paenibacillus nasutitermitis]
MQKTKLAKKKGARAYVRVSTLKESQKDSPEHQEGLIRETAGGEGIEIEHVYLDKGTATNIIDREDVQNMIEDAKSGEFDTIYFASLSRFSRDTLDAVSLKRIMVNALGIRLVSIEDLYDSSKDDNEMIFTIISSVNQKQSENTSTASKRGIRQSAKKGNFTGTIAPYGYRKVVIDGRKALEVVPEEAAIVREIFDLYVNSSRGEKAIVNYLNNDKELPSPKGGLWGLTSVQRILQNDNYTGYLSFGKMESQKVYEDLNDLQNRRKKLVLRDRSLWEKTDFQTHEAIISPELFEQAVIMRDTRGGGKRGGRRAFVNVFAKMIFCKECGAAIVTMGSGRTSDKTNAIKMYRYLMCSQRRRQGEKGCSNSVWTPYVETRDAIIDGIADRVERFVSLEDSSLTTDSASEFKEMEFEKETKKLEKMISDQRRLLFEVRRQNLLGVLSREQYTFEREQYELEIADLEKKQESIHRKTKDRKNRSLYRKEIRNAFSILRNVELDDHVENTRLTLMKLIDKIEVGKNGEVDVYTVLGKL